MGENIFEQDFHALSLGDLLEARDFYHVHLMNKKNVEATAIGRYLIRNCDPWPDRKNPNLLWNKIRGMKRREPRTLWNSDLRPYSWPCILVFVKEWKKETDLVGKGFDHIVPKYLYLPDGKAVPVCLVKAEREKYSDLDVDLNKVPFPSNYISGGFPVISHLQGETHIASVGCLVSDGTKTYALTNKHVAGDPGSSIYAVLNGREIEIGRSSKKQLGRSSFKDIYPGWPGRDMYINLDVGLIEVADKRQWKTEINNLGQMAEIVDLSNERFPLNLVGKNVIGWGSVSGKMEGRIIGLFYRYKALGGFEYVSDFIIGPRLPKNKKERPILNPQHGDSGTLWLLEHFKQGKNRKKETELAPFALQWGLHTFVDNSGQKAQPYSLATCLSTVCNQLEVDLIRDWNIGQDYIWGKVGHNTIAGTLADLIDGARFPKLRQLISANLEAMAVKGKKGSEDMYSESQRPFCPLSTVPDLIWKIQKVAGVVRSPKENPNHYADIDLEDSQGNKLADCRLDAHDWDDFYKKAGIKKPQRGVLPFRVGQIFDEMVAIQKTGANFPAEFICATGVLAHYIADAATPLHCSIYSQGDSDPRSKGVHEFFDNILVERYYERIIDQIIPAAKMMNDPAPPISSGKEAVEFTLAFMKKTLETIDPKIFLESYKAIGKNTERPEKIWQEFGPNIIESMARGCLYLARVIEAAWKEGGGEQTQTPHNLAVQRDALISLYKDKGFLKSKFIDEY